MTTRHYQLAAVRTQARRLRRHDGFHELLGNGRDTQINGRPILRTVLLPGDIMQLEEGIKFQVRMNNARVAVLVDDGDLAGNQHMKVRRLGEQLRSRGFLVLHLTPGVTQDETRYTLSIPSRVYTVPGVLKWRMYDIEGSRDIAEWLTPFRSPENVDMDYLFTYLSQTKHDGTLEFLHRAMSEINRVKARKVVVLNEDLTCNGEALAVKEGVTYIDSNGIVSIPRQRKLRVINWATEVTATSLNLINWGEKSVVVCDQEIVIPGVQFKIPPDPMDYTLLTR